MGFWNVVGQVSHLTKKNNFYIIGIGENLYDGNGNKISTIWYNCISRFEPTIKVGDRIIAEGIFEISKNSNFPFAMVVNHIGVISNKESKN